MTNAERDEDMIVSIEMWLHECEPKYVEKELAWLDELRTRLLEEKPEKPMNQEWLKEEIGSYMSNKWKFGCITPITPVVLPNFTTEDLKECARHFAQWGAEHLKQ